MELGDYAAVRIIENRLEISQFLVESLYELPP